MAFKRLEAHHLIAIQYLAQPNRAGMTMQEIADEAGVSRKTVYEWLKDDLFQRELRKQIVTNSMRHLPDVTKAMADAAVEDRNAAAAKLIYQLNEMLSDKLSVDQTVKGEKDLDAEAIKERLTEFRNRKKGAGESGDGDPSA